MNPSEEETSDSSSSSCGTVEPPSPESACPTTPRRLASNAHSRGGEGWSSGDHARSVSISPSHLRSADIGGNLPHTGFGLRDRAFTERVTHPSKRTAHVDRKPSGEDPALSYPREGNGGNGGGCGSSGGGGDHSTTPVHGYRHDAAKVDDESNDTLTQKLEYSPTHALQLPSNGVPTTRGRDRNSPGKSSRPTSPVQRPLSAPPNSYLRTRSTGPSQEKSAMSRSGSGWRGGNQSSHGYNVRYSNDGAQVEKRAAKSRTSSESETAQVQARSRVSSAGDSSPERRRSYEAQLDEQEQKSRERLEEIAFEGGESFSDEKEIPLSSEDFGLRRWKEYAVLRHGGTRRFFNSKHGRDILMETAATIRADEVDNLTSELKDTRALAEELHSALRAEQSAKATLQARIASLEQELEGVDFARRRWQRDDANLRERGSNLERRLAGNTGNLRMFLFGAGSRGESVSPVASPLACSSRLAVPRGRTAAISTRKNSITGSARRPSIVSSTGTEDGGSSRAAGEDMRRLRDAAALERSELRRRHDVEMLAKQTKLEKMKLDLRKLEAERDGLKQAAKGQVGLFKDGYAELKACLAGLAGTNVHHTQSATQTDPEKQDPDEARDARIVTPDHSPSGSGGGGGGGGGGGDGGTSESEETKAWKKTMLATEEGLNHQVRTLQGLLIEAVAAAVPTVSMPVGVTAAVDSIRDGMGLPPLKYTRESSHFHNAGRSTSLPITSVVGGNVLFRDGKVELAGYEPREINEQRLACHENGPYQNGSQIWVCDDDPRYSGAAIVGAQTDARLLDAAGLAERFVAGKKRGAGTTTGRETRTPGSSTESVQDEKAEKRAYGFTRRRFPDSGDEGSITASEGSGTRFPPVMPTDEDSEEDTLYSDAPCLLDGATGHRSRDGEGEGVQAYDHDSRVEVRGAGKIDCISAISRANSTGTQHGAAEGRLFPCGGPTKINALQAQEGFSKIRGRFPAECDNKHRAMLAEVVDTAAAMPTVGVSMTNFRQAPLLRAGER